MVKKEKSSPQAPPITSLSGALRIFQKRFSFSPRMSRIPVQDSLGRTTAEAIFSPLSVPAAHLSEVDGIAVRSKDTLDSSGKKQVFLTDVIPVNTGNVVLWV